MSPKWLVGLTWAMFRGMWKSYDGFFRGIFGEGERTVYKDEDKDVGSIGGEEERIGSSSSNHDVTEKMVDPHQLV